MIEARKTTQGTPEREDLALVREVVSGRHRAFETLVRKHERRVFRVTLAVLGNVEDAEEAMQDTFVKAFRHIEQFRGEAKFTTWLTRIAVNEALQKRKGQEDTAPFDDLASTAAEPMPHRCSDWLEDPERLYAKEEVRQIVERAIHSLPAIYREAVVLRDIEGLSAEEAAETLGVKVPALKSRLLRGRLMLREVLASSFEQPRTLRSRMVNTAAQMRDALMMRLMRAARR